MNLFSQAASPLNGRAVLFKQVGHMDKQALHKGTWIGSQADWEETNLLFPGVACFSVSISLSGSNTSVGIILNYWPTFLEEQS